MSRSTITVTISESGEIIRIFPIVMKIDRHSGKLFGYDENSGREYSIAELEQIANTGDPAAQCAMGDYYNSEDRPDLQNFKKAFEWYDKAAKQNYARAQWNLGNIYGVGAGVVEKDFNKAMSWFEKSANQGYLEAMFNLGQVFLMNDDHANALFWLEKADKLGHPQAKDILEMATILRRFQGK